MRRPKQVARSSPAQLAHTRALVLQYGWNSMAYQILNPGIRRWFPAQFDSVIGYVEAGGYRVVAGAPVCAPERLSAVAAAFAEDTQRAGKRLCYFGAQERLITSMELFTPASALLLGAQPTWEPAAWPAIIGGKASLRAQLSRARNKHVEIHEWPAEQASNHPELRRCLTEWLSTRGLPPMRFLVEWNILPRLLDRRVWVALREGQVVGYLIGTPVPSRHGWLVEQIIRGAKAPNGTNELLLDAAMRALADDGACYVTLGLSPLAHVTPAQRPRESVALQALLAAVRIHGQRFYNFTGLERFKSKFQPQAWEPIYAVTNTRRFPLRALYAIAGAFGGESPLRFVSRALLRAAQQEARWVLRK